jgi:hypothetical protein
MDMLLSTEVHSAATKYCPSLVNWIVERDMNQNFNHQTYGLKPNHRPLGSRYNTY